MIVVAAECRILEKNRQDFENQMKRLAPMVHKEAGCLKYEPLLSMEEPGLFVILEEWESKKHLEDHLTTPHMIEHKKITAPWSAKPVSLSLYEIQTVDKIKL